VREVARLSLKEAGSLATIVGVVGPLDGDARLPGAVLADVGGCLVRAGGTLAERLSSPNFAGRRVLLTGLIERESFQWRMDLQSITSISDAMERWATAESLTLDLARVPEENLKPLLALLKRFPGSTPVTMEWLPAEAPRVLRSIARRHVLVCPLLEEGLNRYATGRWKVSYNKDGTLRQQSRLEALAARIGLGDLRKFLPS
jgi:hypothetical protein